MITIINNNNEKDLVKLPISIFPSCPLLRALANTLPSRTTSTSTSTTLTTSTNTTRTTTASPSTTAT